MSAFGGEPLVPSRLPEGHLEAVCKPGQGEACCAYLALGPFTAAAGASWSCAKAAPDLAEIIRQRLEAGQMTAKGDNCTGPPDYTRPA